MVVGLALLAAPAASAARFPIPSPMPTILHAPCPVDPDAGGCAYVDPVALASGAYGDDCPNPAGCIFLRTRNRFARWHELGHAWDQQKLTDSDRRWFARKLEMAGQPWFDEAWNPGGSPGERFADAYANCALRNTFRRGWETAYDYMPTLRRHRAICNAIVALDLARP